MTSGMGNGKGEFQIENFKLQIEESNLKSEI